MRKRNIFVGILCASLVSGSGCSAITSNSNTSTNQQEEYSAILPYESSDTRVKHVGIIASEDVRIQIEDGLMDLSKQHFSPSEVGYKTHTFLDYDELDATDGSRGLLGTLRDDNPNGLNPSTNDEFDTGNGKVKGATILVDIYELDWYAKDDLKGISLGLVVNDRVGDKNTKIKKSKMREYLKVTSTKLVNYMRSRFNEINDNIPIYVATYELNGSEAADDTGGYIYSGYFEGNNQDYTALDEKWYRVPSTSLTSKDSTTADQFTSFQDAMKDVLPDNTYVIGSAEYEGDTLTKMTIEITAHGKTAGEMLAVSQSAQKNLSKFKKRTCEYTVRIMNNDTVYCMMKRAANSTEVQSVTSM